MKKMFFTLLFLPFTITCFAITNEEITLAIKKGNASEIAKHFTDNVDLKIIDKDDFYSKAQAELILKDFFVKNPVKSFNIIHKGESKQETQYYIGSLETTKGKFRIYYLIKKDNDKIKISQFRVETENE